jgi:hypothetical protein
MPEPPPPPLLPGPTTPLPPLEDEEQPPNHAMRTVAAIRVANMLRLFIRPSTIDEERVTKNVRHPTPPPLSNLSSYPKQRPRSRMSRPTETRWEQVVAMPSGGRREAPSDGKTPAIDFMDGARVPAIQSSSSPTFGRTGAALN